MAIGTTAAILGAAALGAGGSLLAGGMQANAANQAAQTQANASTQSLALQAQQYNQSREDAMPWMEAGRKALAAYQGELGLSDEAKAGTFTSGFAKTPGYEFQVQEGEKGVLNNLAALGMKNSGSALKALSRFRTGLADQTYDKYLNRLAGGSSEGGNTVNANANLGANYAGAASNTLADRAAATASGYIGSANAWTGALGGITNTAGNALGYLGNNKFRLN